MNTTAPTTAPVEKKSAKIHVKLVRAVWDEKGERLDEGTVLEMTKDEAFEKIESGAMIRAKPEEVGAAAKAAEAPEA
jgi:hypothetical protein